MEHNKSSKADSFNPSTFISSFDSTLQIIGKLILLIPLIIWCIQLITASSLLYIPLDYANFIIHESGHIIALLLLEICNAFNSNYALAQFIHVAAGTFMQLAVPLICAIYFLLKKQWYSMFFGLYWTADNIIGVHFYLGDAICQCLPLVSLENGGSGATIHDWNYLLTNLHLLSFTDLFAKIVYYCGVVIFIVAIAGMLMNILATITQIKRNNKAIEEELLTQLE